jgi:hypothetical protein
MTSRYLHGRLNMIWLQVKEFNDLEYLHTLCPIFEHRPESFPFQMDLRKTGPGEPVAVTNKGLRISLLLYHGRDTVLGVLNCYSLDYPQGRMAIVLEGHSKAVSGLGYRRISPEILRAIPVTEVMQIQRVYIHPVWMLPSAPISRFPLIDISTKHALANYGYSLQKSSLVVSQDSAKRLMSCTPGDGSKTMVCVKVQWLEMSRRLILG